MIKAIIIDDEQHCINRLQSLIQTYFSTSVELLGAFSTVDEARKGLDILQPELVFLDIELRNTNSFDLLQSLPSINLDIIFTTAFDHYAVKAFKFSAVDYLLKPVDVDDLKEALLRVRRRRSEKYDIRVLDLLYQNLLQTQGETKKIAVPTVNGLMFLNIKDIIRCKSDINYTTIYLNHQNPIVVAKTLKEFELLLAEYGFFRVHNSHLVNLKKIKSYNKGKGGYITLEDGTELEVSTRRKEDFLKKLNKL